LASFGHPSKFQRGFASWLRYCTDVAQRTPTKLCTMFGRLLGWYTIYTFRGLLLPHVILPGAKLTLGASLAFSYIGSVTAHHSSRVQLRQPNFTAFSRGRHLYSAGRPSRLASAHILVLVHRQVTIIFVVSVSLSVCLCRVFLSRLRSDLDQTRTHVTCPGLVVSPRI